jgi:hypothetical protein
MLDTASLRERLSPQERIYASGFFVALGRHMKESVLKDLPTNYQSLVRGGDGDGFLCTGESCYRESCRLDLGSRVA